MWVVWRCPNCNNMVMPDEGDTCPACGFRTEGMGQPLFKSMDDIHAEVFEESQAPLLPLARGASGVMTFAAGVLVAGWAQGRLNDPFPLAYLTAGLLFCAGCAGMIAVLRKLRAIDETVARLRHSEPKRDEGWLEILTWASILGGLAGLVAGLPLRFVPSPVSEIIAWTLLVGLLGLLGWTTWRDLAKAKQRR